MIKPHVKITVKVSFDRKIIDEKFSMENHVVTFWRQVEKIRNYRYMLDRVQFCMQIASQYANVHVHLGLWMF